MSESTFQFETVDLARTVLGERDANLMQIEKALDLEIRARGTQLVFQGSAESCQKAQRMLMELQDLARQGHPLSASDITQALRILDEHPMQSISELFLDSIMLNMRHAHITPKTMTQKAYVEAIRKYDIVFAWGPAGTGKTYLAMAMAVAALVAKKVDRIILTRPAVEAGEKLGFLPGDLVEKVNPYLRPLYDAMHDMMEFEKAERLIERGVIEVAPLAFMRGRTLNKSFVILDEAQNTSSEQMKMFLTRLGFDSKAVITGDITQVDLPHGKLSGLIEAIDLLKDVEGIGFAIFTDKDVVRHPLVQKIIGAYEAAEQRQT